MMNYVVTSVLFVALLGYCLNLIKFIVALFKWSLKEIAARFIGVLFVPLGCLFGFMSSDTDDD